MHSENVIQSTSVQASANLAYPNRFVKVSSGKLAYCGLYEKACGVLGAKADANEMATVKSAGWVLVESGGAVSSMAHVSADALGRAIAVPYVQMVNAAATQSQTFNLSTQDPLCSITVPAGTHNVPGQAVNGIAIDAASAAGELIRVLVL